MTQATCTLALGPFDEPQVRALIAGPGVEFEPLEHAFWKARMPDAVVCFYRSGKLVIQGRTAEPLAARIALSTGARLVQPKAPKPPPTMPTAREETAPGDPLAAATVAAPESSRGAVAVDTAGNGDVPTPALYRHAVAALGSPSPAVWIGIDETGKGDYFGPLVCVAACVRRRDLAWLAEMGVGDSKQMTDHRVTELAKIIKPAIRHQVLVLSPPKYNELYAKFRNLNRLLAWCHATASEKLAEGSDAEVILSDQFAPTRIVPGFFKGHAKTLRYLQRPRAEDDPAVGAASVIARAEFVFRIAALAKEHGVELPKGAGSPVVHAGRRIVRERGPAFLDEVAKVHFKTTEQIGARAPSA